MTRFIAPKLAGLPPPPSIENLDFDAILAARLADLAAGFAAQGLGGMAAVLNLPSEPQHIAERTDALFELGTRGRVNDAVRAVLVATAKGRDLDHVNATFYGVARLPLVESPRDFDLYPEDWEDDETFRPRGMLSMEARSAAGPEGAYVYQAREASGLPVAHAVCYGEEDGARYADGTAVLAPEILVVVLARAGDGTPNADLLAQVRAQLSPEDVRPIGDKVTVEPAIVAPYAIDILLRVAPGLSQDPIKAAARTAVEAYRDEVREIGRLVQPDGIAAAAKVPGVRELFIRAPLADLDPGPKGAGFCTGIAIEAEEAREGWR